MACSGSTLTASRKKTGFVKQKGYRAISFGKWDGEDLIVNTPTGVTALPVSLVTPPAIYRFEVKNTADIFTEVAAKDLTTMTGQKTGTGTFALMYCDRIKNLADAEALFVGVWNVFFEMNDGESIIVAGSVNGGEITQIEETTDAQGFKFTLSTIEPHFAYSLATTGIDDYKDGIVASA